MNPGDVLLLRRSDVAALLDPEGCLAEVEAALRLQAEGRAPKPASLGYPLAGGGFHVKAASLGPSRPYFAAKVNGNFPGNPSRSGLPAIQGVIVLCDSETGSPLALIDSIEVTILRTAAATAAAARRLAGRNSRAALVCGCGNQGRAQLRALARVLPIAEVRAWDADPGAAARYSADLTAELGIPITPVPDPGPAALVSDVVLTCTPSREPYLRRESIAPGTFVAAVGADAPDKRELCPGFLAAARTVVDSLEQCASSGELRHALEEGTMTRADVAAELSEIVLGSRPGRSSEDEVTVFDSTGIALEDVAAAAAVYERALRESRGTRVPLSL